MLAAFADLETLELKHVHDVDLSALAGLDLKRLSIWDFSSVNLEPLGQLPALEVLRIGNFRNVAVPHLALARSLVGLTIVNDDPDLDGRPVEQVVNAIAWPRLRGLQALTVRIGGLYESRPIEVDLGLLRSLQVLDHLVLAPGVHHVGAQPSPLEPPFDGLPKRLTYVRAEVVDPDATQSALRAYLGEQAGLSLKPLRVVREPSRSWVIHELPDSEGWATYGSFAREDRGALDDTEHDALRRAKRRLRAADAQLLRRLEFDPESAGTGIYAASRDDLNAALTILGLGGSHGARGAPRQPDSEDDLPLG